LTVLNNDEPDKSRLRGKVINFLSRKGYGFIQGEDGVKVFVHYSDIRSQSYRTLEVGEEVEFTRVQGLKGPQAVDVVRLNPPSGEEIPPPLVPDRTW